jgi:hypothetical protein
MSSIDDLYPRRPRLEGAERRIDLRQHAAVDHPLTHKALQPSPADDTERVPVAVEDARDIGQLEERRGAQRASHCSRDMVGVDIVRLSVAARGDRRDDRDEPALLQEPERVWIDSFDVTNESQIYALASRQPWRPAAGHEQVGVLAVEPDRVAAVPVDEPDQLRVDLAHEYHLDAAVDDNRVDPRGAETNDVLGEGCAERSDHSIAAPPYLTTTVRPRQRLKWLTPFSTTRSVPDAGGVSFDDTHRVALRVRERATSTLRPIAAR